MSTELKPGEAATKSRLSHVADYADLSATEEQLAAGYGVLEGLIAAMRAAPNEALDAIEPSSVFKLPIPEMTAAAGPGGGRNGYFRRSRRFNLFERSGSGGANSGQKTFAGGTYRGRFETNRAA